MVQRAGSQVGFENASARMLDHESAVDADGYAVDTSEPIELDDWGGWGDLELFCLVNARPALGRCEDVGARHEAAGPRNFGKTLKLARPVRHAFMPPHVPPSLGVPLDYAVVFEFAKSRSDSGSTNANLFGEGSLAGQSRPLGLAAARDEAKRLSNGDRYSGRWGGIHTAMVVPVHVSANDWTIWYERWYGRLTTPLEGDFVSAQVTIGIIGCGSVAQNAYLPLIINLRSQGKVAEVVGCDTDPERLEIVQRRFGVDRVTTDASAVISDPSVDIVLILTSMPEHGALTIQALAAGKNVLVEKPMATTLEEGRRVLEAAEASEGVLVCAPHVQLSPDFQEMYRAVNDGKVGRPLIGRARYGWDGPDWSKWFYAPGGGPLFDLGVYNVTSLTGLLGPVRRVTALSTLTRPERVVEGELITVQTDDTFQIVLEHVEGALSTVTTAFGMQKYRGAAVEVYGLEGTIQLMGDDWAPTGLEYWANEVGAWQVFESAGPYWPWTDGLAHLVDSVLAGEQPYTRPDQAFHVLEIMIGAMRAAETGTTQSIESSFVRQPPRPSRRREDAHRVHDRVHEDAQ